MVEWWSHGGEKDGDSNASISSLAFSCFSLAIVTDYVPQQRGHLFGANI